MADVKTESYEGRQSPSRPRTVYRANIRQELGFFATWVVMAKNVWNARELVWQLFKRDFFAPYRKSFIGITWVFVIPVVGMLSWIFMRGAGLLKPGDVGVPYPVYVLIGTTIWGLFMGLLRATSMTLTAGQSLVMQVNYPHEALLFKQSAEQITNFLIAFVLNVIVLVGFRVVPSWGILLFPVVLLPLVLLAAAGGLILSMIAVVAVDMSKAVEVGLGFLMFLTPVVYQPDAATGLASLVVKWNPLTYLVCSARNMILYGTLYDPPLYFLWTIVSVILFLVSWRLFYVGEHKLIERMI